MKNNEKNNRIIKNPTVAFDLGYGHIKSTDITGKKIIFPTFYRVNKTSIVDQDVIQEYVVKLYDYDSKYIEYAVGDYAKIGLIKKEWSEEQSLNPHTLKIYIGTVLMLLSENEEIYKPDKDGIIHINLSLGLPLEYYNGQRDTLADLMRDLIIDVELRNKRKKFHIDSSLINQQGIGAFFDLIYNENGKIKSKKELVNTISDCKVIGNNKIDNETLANQIMNHGLGIGDIGYNTIDSFYVVKRKGEFVIVDSSAFSINNRAIYKSLSESTDFINRQYGSDIDVFQLEDIISERNYELKYGMLTVNIEEFINKQYDETTKNFISEIERSWDSEKLKTLGAFILTGGGAVPLSTYFQLPILTIIQNDPSFANAHGFLKKMTSLINELKNNLQQDEIVTEKPKVTKEDNQKK